jgi:hypothetical protein
VEKITFSINQVIVGHTKIMNKLRDVVRFSNLGGQAVMWWA